MPPASARILAPAEEFTAWKLDLRDSFDLSRPGAYEVRAAFYERPDDSGAPDLAAFFRVTR